MPPSTEAGFSRFFVAGVLFRCLILAMVMGFGVAGVGVGNVLPGEWSPFLGGTVGIALGIVLARPVKKRWDPLNRVPETVQESVPKTFPIDPRAEHPSPPDD